MALGGEAFDFVGVTAEGEAFVEGCGDLSIEFAGGPLVGGGFDFVESAFVGVSKAHQGLIVRPTETDFLAELSQRSVVAEFIRQCLVNLWIGLIKLPKVP